MKKTFFFLTLLFCFLQGFSQPEYLTIKPPLPNPTYLPVIVPKGGGFENRKVKLSDIIVLNALDSLHISNDSIYGCKAGTCTLAGFISGTITYPYTTQKYLNGYGNFVSFQDSARQSISLTVTGSSGSATYNSTTGVLNVPTYTAAGLGALTGNQTITLSGDVSGSGTTAITTAIGAGKVTNAMLLNSTISGISLGSNLADLTIGTNLQLSSGTTYNGGTAKTISLQNADATHTGALTSTDWSTFNNKQAALVSGTNIRTVNGNSLLGSTNLVQGLSQIAAAGNSTSDTLNAAGFSSSNGYSVGTNKGKFNITTNNVDGGTWNIYDYGYNVKNGNVENPLLPQNSIQGEVLYPNGPGDTLNEYHLTMTGRNAARGKRTLFHQYSTVTGNSTWAFSADNFYIGNQGISGYDNPTYTLGADGNFKIKAPGHTDSIMIGSNFISAFNTGGFFSDNNASGYAQIILRNNNNREWAIRHMGTSSGVNGRLQIIHSSGKYDAIDSNAFIGINTAPDYPLHIKTTSTDDARIKLDATGAASAGIMFNTNSLPRFDMYTDAAGNFYLSQSATVSNPITINTSGNIGINNQINLATSTSTAGNVVLSNANNSELLISNSVATAKIRLLPYLNDNLWDNTGTGDDIFRFGGSSTERFRITQDGNLILSTAPTTSADSYDVLTRNSSTGVIEKVAATMFNQNIANADLRATGNRRTSFANHQLIIDSLGGALIVATPTWATNTIDMTADGGGRNGGLLFTSVSSTTSSYSAVDIDPEEGVDITGLVNNISSTDNSFISVHPDSVVVKSPDIHLRASGSVAINSNELDFNDPSGNALMSLVVDGEFSFYGAGLHQKLFSDADGTFFINTQSSSGWSNRFEIDAGSDNVNASFNNIDQFNINALQINTQGSIIPTVDATNDLGSASNQFLKLFVTGAHFDDNTASGETKFLIYDIDAATFKRVSIGAADSGGTGYKVLRIPN